MKVKGSRESSSRAIERAARESAIESERSAADADQTAADADQTAADADQTASERDAADAVSDQKLADQDQARADLDALTKPDGEWHAASRAARETTRANRVTTRAIRSNTAETRVRLAANRDATGLARDETARLRDLRAEELETELADSEGPLAEKLARLRVAAADGRARASIDRERAAKDRADAADERTALEAELQGAYLDELTGAFRRTLGMVALRHEIDRARRADGRLVLAFIDVDHLKLVNDRDGHAAGDLVLQKLVSIMRSTLRSYDPIVRYGGDEFVCALGGADLADITPRLEAIGRELKLESGTGISIGLASLAGEETLEEVMTRADAALLEAKKARVA